MGRYKSSDEMILFTGIVGLLMIGGLMLGPTDPDVDLSALEDADKTSEYGQVFQIIEQAKFADFDSIGLVTDRQYNNEERN